ncbi:Ribonuclease P protein subunit RPR2 [Fasciolopsis buskii]|uniref:Ribonuclease P protein subunit RPR2 n=1 Tax=Fasciolopsis buskii TaxID=27845 RepID=A0A8E0RP98_9TREM|nr:Ribonuclease P protein subunit RPR2 [Fasciolopsis buski]
MGKQLRTARENAKPSPVQHTMNFLYQQALLIEHANWTSSNSGAKTAHRSLSQNALRQLVFLSEKSHTRLAPELRRTICRKCHALLTCPNGMRLHIRSGKINWQCSTCSTKETISIGKNATWNPSYPELYLENLLSGAVLGET